MFDVKKYGYFIEGLINSHPFFNNYRIVDTNTYNVYEWKAGILIQDKRRCYEIWNREGACQNCISRLAVEEKRQFIKLETLNEKIFLIESNPLPELGPEIALELIHEVTDSLLVNDSYHHENLSLTELIKTMNELAIRDSYTGLYNKRFLEHELQRQVLEWTKEEPLVISIIDIDQFKDVNDTHGHLMGDLVILRFAEELKDCVSRNNGWAGRVGGDEFILVFKGVAYLEVKNIIQNLCKKISQIEFMDGSQSCYISVSAGVVEYRTEMESWRELFRLADQSMYRSKQIQNERSKQI